MGISFTENWIITDPFSVILMTFIISFLCTNTSNENNSMKSLYDIVEKKNLHLKEDCHNLFTVLSFTTEMCLLF